MRAVIQRSGPASVAIEGQTVGSIQKGLVVLLGVEDTDTEQDCDYICDKIIGLRIFEDQDGKMNRSVLDVAGEVLLVSQFTLCGDARKGRRPSFIKAARPETALPLYERAIAQIKRQVPVATGQFQADMQVSLVNDGPVTILLESKRLF